MPGSGVSVLRQRGLPAVGLGTQQNIRLPRLGWLFIQGLALLALTAVLMIFASGGTMRFDRGMRYYDELGAAFLRGQLYLAEQPSQELLALPDPYDATQNAGLKLPDASLYNGHYYLYFGPTPALIHAVWRAVTGSPLDDGIVEVGAALVATAAFWGILSRIRSTYAPTTGVWVVATSTFVFALGGVMLDLVGRPAVYHEAILVAMACLLGGCYLFVLALHTGQRQPLLIFVTGLALGLAVAARLSYVAYAFAFGVALCWYAVRMPRWELARGSRNTAIYAAPLLGTVALLLMYNWARFDSPFEFGTTYQLSGINGTNQFTCGPTYLPTYAALYLLSVPKLQPYFPFFIWDAGPGWGLAFPSAQQLPLATGMHMELPLLSPFLLQPIALLSLIFVPIAALRRGLALPLVTLALALGVGALATIPALSCVYGINLRYFADLTPALALLGSVGLVLGYHWLGRRKSARLPLVGFAILSWIVSLGIGALLGWGVWAFAYPEDLLAPRRITNELWSGLDARLRPAAIQNWIEPTENSTWRAPDGNYFDESTVYLRSTEPGASVVLAADWHDNAPTTLTIQIDGHEVDQQVLKPGRQLLVSKALTGLSSNSIVGLQLKLPDFAGAQPGADVPLTILRMYMTRGEAETAVYRALASNIEQSPSTSDELLATADEMITRKTLADTQAALLDTQAALLRTQDVLRTEQQARIAAQTEVERLQSELDRSKQSSGQGP